MPNSNGLNAPEARVNTTLTGLQNAPQIATLTNGYVVVWVSDDQNGSTDIVMQRYNASGVAQGAETVVNVYPPGEQFQPAVAALPGGGFVVTWTSFEQNGDESYGIFSRRYDANGNSLNFDTQVNSFTPSLQYLPAIAALSNGYVITWASASSHDGNNYGVFMQRYNAAGVAQGGETQVNTTFQGAQTQPTITALTGGGFVVGWTSGGGQDGSGFGIYLQRYDASGIRLGTETRVNSYAALDQSHPVVAALTGGGFVVTWTSDGQDGSGLGVYMQRFSASGIALGAETPVNTYTTGNQQAQSVAATSDGGFAVSWVSADQDGSVGGVYLQRYDANGVARGGEDRLNTITGGDQSAPALATVAGNLVAVWSDASGVLDPSVSGISMRTVDSGVPPTVTIAAAQSGAEAGPTAATFIVTLSAPATQPATVTYAVGGGNATAGADYTMPSGSLVIGVGASSGTITVPILDDTIFEGSESFTVTLTGGTNVTLGTTTIAIGLITDNDSTPIVSVSSVTQSEAAGSFLFDVTLSNASTQTVTVTYGTAPGTATSGTDFTATAGTLTFAPGETSKTVTVAVANDAIYEANETFTLGLISSTNATLGPTTGTGTITNDDAAPVVSVGNASVTEGTGGTAVLTFVVTRTGATEVGSTVSYSAADGTASIADDDYVATAGTLTFGAAAVSASQNVTVTVNGDARYEPDETVLLNVTGATNSTLGTAQGTGTIVNDDLVGTISIDNPSVLEGNARDGTLTFTITRAGGNSPFSLTYRTVAGTATSNVDYIATTGPRTLNFAAGETSRTVEMTVPADFKYEPDETLTLLLENLTANGVFSGGGTTLGGLGTILNDDPIPVFSIGNVSQAEGSAGGTTDFTFTITRTGATDVVSSVAYTTVDGTALSASDYTTTAGILTFAASSANSVTQTVTVNVTADSLRESDEAFSLRLSNATGATLAGGGATLSATGTIQNDDAALSIAGVSRDEGNGGTTSFEFVVTREGNLTIASSATYTVSNGGGGGIATAASDFAGGALPTGTVSFAAGQDRRTIVIPVNADTTLEPDETFTVTLSAPSAGTSLTTASAIGTIVNDEIPGTVSINTANVNENAGVVTLTVTRTGGISVFSVDYATSNNSAIAGQDYTATTGTLTFAAGVNTQTISIPILDDTAFERQEAFTVTLNNPTNGAELSGNAGVVVIIDNDPQIDSGPSAPTPTPTPTPTPVSGDYFQPAGNSQTAISTGDPSSTQPFNVTGNGGNQTITGNAGNNILNGGGGSDTMIGLGGNDTYLVRSLGDVVIEANGGGIDIIYTTVSYNLGVNEVEALSTVQQTDTTPINLIGNFATQMIVGNYGPNVLNGGTGGIDTLSGLFGDDTYAVGDGRTIVIEAPGQGFDTVVTSVDYMLGSGISIELFTAQDRASTQPLALRGNEFAQTIAGNAGANTIDGGAGADILIGGAGADRFLFTTALGNGNVDAMPDFEVGIDRISLASNVFTGIGATVLATNFTTAERATTADQHIVYNQATGQLFYDIDGSGSAPAVLFALVAPGTVLSAGNFEMIAPATTL